MKTLTTDRELNLLKALFFLFGIQIMSWVPRFPEVKANLQLSNGQFGSLLSLGSIGNLTSLLIVGHLVHKFGARQIMQIAAVAMAISLSYLTHSTSSLLFFIFIVIQGASISAFHICINSQGTMRQFYE